MGCGPDCGLPWAPAAVGKLLSVLIPGTELRFPVDVRHLEQGLSPFLSVLQAGHMAEAL
jgi:hypothetical protein